jgi:hypothetical protein
MSQRTSTDITDRRQTRLFGARREQQGATIVEFAFVAPVLFLILFAIFQFAPAIHTQIDFGNALSTGIRTATIDGDGSILTQPENYPGTSTAMLQSVRKIYTDDNIGQSLLLNLRSDDVDRVNWYDVTLLQSRIPADSASNPTDQCMCRGSPPSNRLRLPLPYRWRL